MKYRRTTIWLVSVVSIGVVAALAGVVYHNTHLSNAIPDLVTTPTPFISRPIGRPSAKSTKARPLPLATLPWASESSPIANTGEISRDDEAPRRRADDIALGEVPNSDAIIAPAAKLKTGNLQGVSPIPFKLQVVNAQSPVVPGAAPISAPAPFKFQTADVQKPAIRLNAKGSADLLSGMLTSLPESKNSVPAAASLGSLNPDAATFQVAQNKPQMYTRAMVTDNSGRIWIASEEGGLWCVDSKAPNGRQVNIVGDQTQIRFPMSLTIDSSGHIWVGTEDDGVWSYDEKAPVANRWAHFTTKEGLGDNDVYALITDNLGRIWAGHLNHGVSVFNGRNWQNYNVIQNLPRDGVPSPDPHPAFAGPLGPRVFAIAASPKDGDIWIGTDAGISRYSLKNDSWTYFTRADGLPADQISAIAFAKDGTIYAASQCDGLAVGSPQNNFATWRVVSGVDKIPTTPNGTGLPTNLLNTLLVTPDDTLYIGTTTGLAYSSDRAKTFQYLRGQDYAEKVRGLFGGPPPGWSMPTAQSLSSLLNDDFITAFAYAADGHVLIGYRNSLPQSIDSMTLKPGPLFGKMSPAHLALLLPTIPQVSQYKPKLEVPSSINAPVIGELPSKDPVFTAKDVPLPKSAANVSLQDLNAALAVLARVPMAEPQKADQVIALPDDWRTQGAWLGRYGRYWMCLCAAIAPSDLIWGPGTANVEYVARIGPKHMPEDSLRYWVSNTHVWWSGSLELPMPYLHSRVVKNLTTWDVDRRQSGWDDHGEAYPWRTQQGPDLYCTLTIPEGRFVLSLYNVNPGSQGPNKSTRDFPISIRQNSSGQLNDINDFEQRPELARARVRDYLHGVYKRFLVTGPTQLTVKIDRNYAFDACLSGVALDPLEEAASPYQMTRDQWELKVEQLAKEREELIRESKDDTAAWARHFAAETGISQASSRLGKALEIMQLTNWSWHATDSRRYYAMLARTCVTLSDLKMESWSALASCYYQLGLFDEWEKCLRHENILTAREIEKGIRWDGQPDITDTYCLDLVTAFCKEHEHTAQSNSTKSHEK